MVKKKSGSARQVLSRLRKLHSSRSKTVDKGLSHKKTRSVKQLTEKSLRGWIKRPGSMDIRGVDTRTKRRKSRK